MKRAPNTPIGEVECSQKACTEVCKVYRFRERTPGRSSAFSGRLYFECTTHGRIGADPKPATQDSSSRTPKCRPRSSGSEAGKIRNRASPRERNGYPKRAGFKAGPKAGDGSGPQRFADPVVGSAHQGLNMDEPKTLDAETLRLAAEADAVLSSAPEDPVLGQPGEPAPGAPPLVDPVESFRPVVTGLVGITSVTVLPQWDLTDQERGELSESMSMCLAQLFPDGLDGKYACWFRLVACVGIITVDRAVKHGGKLPGIGPKKADPEPTPAHAAAQAA